MWLFATVRTELCRQIPLVTGIVERIKLIHVSQLKCDSPKPHTECLPEMTIGQTVIFCTLTEVIAFF